MYFEAVCPETVFHALSYLQKNNALHSDIEIILGNAPSDLLSLSAENDNVRGLQISDCSEEDENPLDFHRFRSEETAIIPNAPTSVELSIGPGEEKRHKLLTLIIINYKYY